MIFTVNIQIVASDEAELLSALEYFNTTFGSKIKSAYGQTGDLTLNVSLEEADYAGLVSTITTLRGQYATAGITFGY